MNCNHTKIGNLYMCIIVVSAAASIYLYDPNGRVLYFYDPNGQVIHVYDPNGRVIYLKTGIYSP